MTRRLASIVWLFLAALVLAGAGQAWAQSFPKLSGRVVDAANLLSPDQETQLTLKLAALEKQSGRQVVVATLPDLQGYDIADYGYRLGRGWGIGAKGRNDGALLIVAPKERKVRIEVGYGLEGILTDALSSRIIRNAIIPRFKANDYPGGVMAGADELTKLLLLPPDEARKVAAQAEQEQRQGDEGGGVPIFLIFILLFFVLPMIFGRRQGRAYRDGIAPAILWGAMTGAANSRWGGGGGSGWGGGGGGGFSGGGGSFGGGGASGSW